MKCKVTLDTFEWGIQTHVFNTKKEAKEYLKKIAEKENIKIAANTTFISWYDDEYLCSAKIENAK